MLERAGNDDAVERLRSALDELTAGVAVDAPDLLAGDTNERVVHQDSKPHAMTDRRPSWRPLAAVAAAVVVVAGGGVMLLGGRDDGSLGTTDPPVTAPATSAPGDPTNDTDDERFPLAAVPEGWDVIEWGDVRLAVPGEWQLTDTAEECDSVRVGTSADILSFGCAGVSVTIRPHADDTAEPTGVINGIPVADLGGDGCIGCEQFLSSPVWGGQIGIGVDAASPEVEMIAEQIRDTITVSGRWRAANEPPPPVPSIWVETRHLGVTLSVPPSWIVRQAHPGESDPDGCRRAGLITRTVLLERGVFDDDDCPFRPPLLPTVDGVRIYPCEQQGPSNQVPLGPTLGDPVIWLRDDQRCVVVRIGIGVDPTIGLTVLGSLHGINAQPTEPTTGDDHESATTASDVDRLQWEFELPPRTDARGSEWARTAPGSRTLRVAFGHFNRTPVPGNPCAPEFVPEVTETDAEVRVSVIAVVEFSADAPADRFDWFIADDGTVVADCDAKQEQRIVDVDLAIPLGDRRLVFAGQHVDVFTTQLVTPRWMPDGWQPTLDEAFGLHRPDVDIPVWHRTWESQPETRGQFLCEPRTQTGLALLEGPTELVESFTDEPWDPGIIDTHDINGNPADYALDTDTNRTRLTWTIGDTTYVLQSLEFATLCPLGDPPDLDTTLRFARELTP